jgi:hypothetical protein
VVNGGRIRLLAVADFPPDDDVCGALETHVREFFTGYRVDVLGAPPGPIRQSNPHFRVLRVGSGSPGVRVYVSTGGWAATEDSDHGSGGDTV